MAVGSPLKRVLLSPVLWALLLLGGLAAVTFGFVVGSRDGNNQLQQKQTARLLKAKVPTGVVNERTGSYRGVALDDPKSKVIRVLGEPLDDHPAVVIPPVANNTAWNGLNVGNCRARPRSWLLYRELTVSLGRGRVCALEIAGGGWSTSGGIAAGDRVAVVRDRFGQNACREWNPSEDPFWSQWNCEVRLENGIGIHFAGDPLTWVAVTRPKAQPVGR